MDIRDNALVASTCMIVMLAVLCVAAWSYQAFRETRNAQETVLEATLQAELEAERQRRAQRRQTPQGQTFAERARAAARIEELKTMLDRKNQLLESKTRQLNKALEDYENLRLEMNASFANMLEMIAPAHPDSPPGGPQKDASPPSPSATTGSAAELAAVRQELLDWQQNQELDELRTLLDDTTDELSRLQTEADQEILALTEEIVRFRAITADVMARIGAPAIPVLVSYLGDEQAGVRRWSAEMLAEFGPAAEEAIPALDRALSDRDAGVRQAAKQSLAQIRE